MHGTRKWHGEPVLAWSIVLLLHALLWRGLSRIDVVSFRDDEDATRLQLIWIDRAPPPVVPLPEAIAPPAVRKPRIRSGASAKAVQGESVSTRENSPPQPTRSLSAVFLLQARRTIEQADSLQRAPVDPFASRNGGFQAPAADTIRMKRQISPRDVVAAVGQLLFAPPGYEQDPCRENARNIRRLMTDLDAPAMQRELDYEREYCRP